uniref:peptidylprolyl isomerase n=1 Tax=candidate division WOR-3 bacterium TaxID=2052148 RepID=A0A7C4XLL7_UNCW3
MMLFFLIFAAQADQIAAIVGDEVVLESEVSEYAEFLSNDPMAQRMFTNYQELRDYVIQELVSRKLLFNQAEVESITISNEEVQDRVKEVMEEVKKRFPSEADFFKALEEQGLTLEELNLKYTENIRIELVMRQLIQKKFATKITISPVAVKNFYEDNKDSIAVVPGRIKLAHILLAIRPSEEAMKDAFQRALEVYQLLMSGGEFGVIAREFSEDENSKRNGGMLGRVKKGETFEEFEKVIFSLKPGIVSTPFPTRLGYHIVEILNKGRDWVLARQILIKVAITKADTMRCENLARKIVEQIKKGADFDSLAKQYSNASNIDLGEFFIKQFTPPYDEIVAKLKPGEISEPILTPEGFHLLYAREKTEEKFLTFEEMRDQIYQYLYQQELQRLYNQLVDELKSKTYVKVFPLKD